MPRKKAAAPPAYSSVAIVLDASGSMAPFRETAICLAKKQEDEVRVGDEMNLFAFADNVWRVDSFNSRSYVPAGQTALFDAVGDAIRIADDGVAPVLIIVLTDGEENASKQYTAYSLRNLIANKMATDRFTFAFMVPPGYKNRLMRDLGIAEGQITEWERTEAALNKVMMAASVGTQNYYTSRDRGLTKLDTFFTDASSIPASSLPRSCTPIPNAHIWTVDKECEISEFVEKQGHRYRPGAAYYTLMKPEEVQSYKQLLIMEKGKRQVWGGQNVRNMLGLPYHDAKLVPGNHANYDIFVESRSHNRKLVRGTKLVYLD